MTAQPGSDFLTLWRVICWALIISAPVLAPMVAVQAATGGLSALPAAWMGFGNVTVLSMFLGFFACRISPTNSDPPRSVIAHRVIRHCSLATVLRLSHHPQEGG